MKFKLRHYPQLLSRQRGGSIDYNYAAGTVPSPSPAGYGLVGPQTRAKLNELIATFRPAPVPAPGVLTPEVRAALIAQIQEEIRLLTIQLLQLRIKLLQEQVQALRSSL